jgi:hypothetical protein
MRIDLAQNIRLGDTIYNCFMDKLVVSSISKKVGDTGGFNNIVFGTVDTRLRNAHYDSNDVYFEDLYGESDDEKSWVEWAQNNRDFLYTFDHIETTKEIYKIGFCNGFEHKRKMSYEEMMQK